MERRRRSIQIPLTTRARVARDVDDELHMHFAMRVEELMLAGASREDAERQAHAQFGDVDRARQALISEDMVRESERRTRLSLESWRQDVRYAWRQLVRQRVFTAVALLTLALGTGVTMAIFSIVDGVLLRPLPFNDPQQLVRLYSIVRGDRWSMSVPDFFDFRSQSRTLQSLTAHYTGTTNYVDRGDPLRLNATRASDNLFATLGVAPLLGRTFRPGEDEPSAPRLAVINESLWRSAFGADSNILGRILQLDGEATEVIGVVPEEKAYPAGSDLWLTTRFSDGDRDARQRGARYLRVIGRLAPDATVESAQTELSGIASRLAQADTTHNTNVTAVISTLQEAIVGSMRRPLFMLLIAVAFVLLIATVNVANLSLARASAREGEFAVRAALGAGQGRLMRQLITECALLGIVGTALGAVLARLSLGALLALAPGDLPRLDSVRMDARVYAFAVLLAAAGGLAIGVVPALHVGAVNVAQRLREGARGLVRGAVQRRRQALVVGEIALAVVLLVGAGLMIRTLGALRRVDPGFSAENVHMFTVTLPSASYPTLDQQHRFATETEERLRALPGVVDAGLSFGLPLTEARFSLTFTIRGRPEPRAGEDMSAQIRIASPAYFNVLRLPLKRGRHFTSSDVATAPRVIVVSEELARRYFPNEDPLGLYLETGWKREGVGLGGTIVGIVGDVRSESLSEPPIPFLYVPERQWPFDEPTFVVRMASAGGGVALAAREIVRSIDATLPVFESRALDTVVSEAVSQERFLGSVLSLFSLLAVALSAIGIYGVVAYGVEQRRRELGVRLALGASRERVLSLVLREGVRLAVVGGVLGIAGALALTSLLKTFLYGVRPSDPVTILSVALTLVGVAAAASLAPALRAARLQPTAALRES